MDDNRPVGQEVTEGEENLEFASDGSTHASKPRPMGRESVTQTEERVQHIVKMMCEFQWKTGRSDLELGEKWGVTRAHVRRLSAEARRWLARDQAAPEDTRSLLLTNLEEIASRALCATTIKVDKDGCEHEIPTPDFKAAVQCVLGTAELLGLKRNAVELSGPGGSAIQHEITPAEVEAIMASAFGGKAVRKLSQETPGASGEENDSPVQR